LRDADGGLVEDEVYPAHQPPYQGCVADVCHFQAYPAAVQRFGQVLPAAADEVIQHDDLAGAGRHKLIDDRGPDRAGSTGYQATLSCYHNVPSIIRRASVGQIPCSSRRCQRHLSCRWRTTADQMSGWR
jgi:hypothetical protein